MKKFSVYYSNDWMLCYKPAGAFDKATFARVAVVEARCLEDLFRKMNVVDGDELPVELKVRSMSSGDVARDLTTGEMWMCAPVGWVNLADAQG